jgi:hypothetical protein
MGRFFRAAPRQTPRARLGLSPPAFAFALPHLAAMAKTALYCSRCFGFRGYSDWDGNVITWIPARLVLVADDGARQGGRGAAGDMPRIEL